MPDANELQNYLACPRCDQTPLTRKDQQYRCDACKIDFPAIDGIPWMFADPGASLGEWRNRLQLVSQKLSHEISSLDADLKNKDLHSLTRRRLKRYKSATEYHRRSLQTLLQPVDVQSLAGNYETYLALRTRLPPDQGLNTYYANVHRDWCWGDEENEASLSQVKAVLKGNTKLGETVVLGAGAGRLAYDLHMQTDTQTTIAVDFNPLLLLIAKGIVQGEQLKLYEFPIAPKSLEDGAVLRQLAAPEIVRPGFYFVLGDVVRPPFAEGCFDTVVTPWIIDILSEDLLKFAARINKLLKPGGRWVNFGSLAFTHPQHSRRYSPEETAAIIAENGFSAPYISEATIPYMCSPASRHGRQEKVFSFSAAKERDVEGPERHRALPDWIVTGKESVPLTHSFRTQAMTTQIYSFIMSLIDGKRSIDDMSGILEKQNLMTRDEAVPAIRSFLTKMYDDSQ
jgi:SAM-dependent methyltransferase/uncharacterized protein YbaR (Trm112 family)